MTVISAFNETTADNLQLDAGVILYDVSDISKLENGTFDMEQLKTLIKTNGIGATKGGATFTATPEVRNVLDGFNGVRGNYVGSDIVDSWDISLKTTMSEVTLKNLQRAMNTDVKASRGSDYDMITSTVGMVKKTQYKNIAWCGQITGKKKPVVILLKNATNMSGVNITAADKDTGSVEVEFKAHFTLCDDTVPYAIYYPNK